MSGGLPPSEVAQRRTARIAFIALVVSAVAAGSSGTLVRLSEVGPITTAFWRVALAAPLFWAWTLMEARGDAQRPQRPRRRDYLLLATTGVLLGAELSIWHWSLQFTFVANATLLHNLSPVWVALGGWLFLGHRFNRTFLLGMAAAIGGAALLMAESVQLNLSHALGDSLAILAGLLFATYVLLISRLRARFSTAEVVSWACTFAALATLPVALLTEAAVFPMTFPGWAVLVGIALVSQAGSETAFIYALAHLSAAFTALTFLIIPVTAAALAWVVLAEPISALQAMGAAIVIAGIVVAERATR